jgi:hypothetical protein
MLLRGAHKHPRRERETESAQDALKGYPPRGDNLTAGEAPVAGVAS